MRRDKRFTMTNGHPLTSARGWGQRVWLLFVALYSALTLTIGLTAYARDLQAKDSLSPAPSNGGSTPPPGMVWIPAGEFLMGGVGPEARADEFPLRRVWVDGFWMDETAVTNAQFRKFVEATNYLTTAERPPNWEDLKKQLPPGTPKPDATLLVPGSMVFKPTDGPVSLKDYSQWCAWVPGASWQHPLGPESSLAPGDDTRPVVHVSWDDAVAYCKWADKRLPTEAEWEYAARGGEAGKRFVWGDDPPSATHPQANLWQGHFPYDNTLADGYHLSSPVKSFPPNGYGLYDMAGNVWQWCADWYRSDAYRAAASGITGGDSQPININPQGPAESYDPSAPNTPKRVNRGGSFLCNADYCASYRPSARMRTPPDTGELHLGFRCVRSPSVQKK
jgi:sulfatase modifying factor 1